jgi:hypothetical protein
MAKTNKGPLFIGILLGLSFVGVLILIFSPIYGGGKNGLDFADDLFNKLAKGSSYFIPNLKEDNKPFRGKTFTAAIRVEKPQEAERINKLFSGARCKVEVQGTDIKIEGDLGKIVDQVLKDSDLMFHNQGKEIVAVYGFNEKEVMKSWWTGLSKIDKFFKKNLKVEQSNHLTEIMKKGLEPAYNFYQIEPQRVIDRAGLMTFLLAFYVFYTLWWGFAIFYLFDGVGLTMKKAKIKKEV